MEEQDDFFASKHKQLLSIATWAEYFAWVVLIVFLLNTIGSYTQEQARYLSNPVINNYTKDFVGYLVDNPALGISLIFESIGILLKGIVYFLVLKGVSLGLNMIVETDINYRDKMGGGQ